VSRKTGSLGPKKWTGGNRAAGQESRDKVGVKKEVGKRGKKTKLEKKWSATTFAEYEGNEKYDTAGRKKHVLSG